ncbi:hypothetical protein FRC04_011739 [Tulasnella sp. 424]|nr:hypothetical protein FRC04_011739 [Tulasnella sp. 424]
MHHLQPFQKLWAELRSKVIALQKKGYFGDGFWSSGQRLQDASRAQGDGVGGLAEILPEYICGGAHNQKRSGYMRSRRARLPRKEVVPSLSTGAQTAKKRKPGSRLTKELPGQGVKLSDDGGSRGKQAQSKRAREERALAVERRLQALQGQPSPSTVSELPDGGSEDEEELQPEDDEFRRATMLEVFSAGELEQMRLGSRTTDAARPPDSDDPAQVPSQKSLGKRPAEETEVDDTPQEIEWPASTSTDSGLAKRRKTGQSILKDEIAYRNKEKLGMTGPGKKLGTGKPRQTKLNAKIEPTPPVEIPSDWTCATCTLINHSDYARCAACGEPRQFIDQDFDLL